MPDIEKLLSVSHDMSVAYVDDGAIKVKFFKKSEQLIEFLDQHSNDPVSPIIIYGKVQALTLMIETKKVITKVEKMPEEK